jgi:hypothetical protein
MTRLIGATLVMALASLGLAGPQTNTTSGNDTAQPTKQSGKKSAKHTKRHSKKNTSSSSDTQK